MSVSTCSNDVRLALKNKELTNVEDETKEKSMGPKVWLNRRGPTHGLYTHTVLYSLSLS